MEISLFPSIKRKAEDTSEADVLKPTYLLIWLCFSWNFSSSAFWMTVILYASTAELRYEGTFSVMTWSSSWHSFISRHMSFPGILWLPTCVFAKHLAHRECCNVPDLLTEPAKQPYVTTQTVWVMSKIFIVINNPVWNYLEILFSPAACAANQNSFYWGRQNQAEMTTRVPECCTEFAAQCHMMALLKTSSCYRQRS